MTRVGGSARAALDRLTRRLFPRGPDFFALLNDQCAVMADALEALVAFTEAGAPADGARVRALEKRGDRLRARNLAALDAAFSTPIDREAIYEAVVTIDDVMNYAKTTVREIEMLAVPPDPHLQAMARELRAGGRALADGFRRLRADPAAATACAAVAHKSERNVEKAYRRAIAELFSNDERDRLLGSGDPRALSEAFDRLLDALRRREVYRHVSNAADRLDAAGRALLDIVVGSV